MNSAENEKIIFPRAFAFAIDDLGWIQGSSLGHKIPSGPFRNGVKRKFDLDDYKHVVEIAKAAGVRVQGLFILSEFDRENVLATYPTTTYMREKWDNSANTEDLQLHIIDFVVENAAHLEFGFHGTGHEYWIENGPQKRAEWYNMEDRHPWPEASMKKHIEAFGKIMAQYKLSPEYGHSFPETFVACAYSYYWNPKGEYSIGKLVSHAGVKYSNTDFAMILELDPPKEKNAGGFDNGTHVISRLNYGNLWCELQSLPRVPLDEQYTDVVETHWANWLAMDDFLQPETSAKWIDYYRAVASNPDRYPAKNTEQLHSQWLHNHFTTVVEKIRGEVEIDNTKMPSEAIERGVATNMVLKIPLKKKEHLSTAQLNGIPVITYYEQDNFGFLYLPVLSKQKYTLHYSTGEQKLPFYIFNDGTYNIYKGSYAATEASFTIRMYGEQIVKIYCRPGTDIKSDNPALLVSSVNYDNNERCLELKIRASDFQGTTGTIKIIF